MADSALIRRIKQQQGTNTKRYQSRLTDAAYLYLNDEAERRGTTASKALSEILMEHKMLRARFGNTKCGVKS